MSGSGEILQEHNSMGQPLSDDPYHVYKADFSCYYVLYTPLFQEVCTRYQLDLEGLAVALDELMQMFCQQVQEIPITEVNFQALVGRAFTLMLIHSPYKPTFQAHRGLLPRTGMDLAADVNILVRTDQWSVTLLLDGRHPNEVPNFNNSIH